MLTISIETLKCPSVAERHIEVVERKGLGHPDTICDLLCEELSRALASYYLDNFGSMLHHNVDKSLLVDGRSLPAFAGGQVLQPMDLFLFECTTTSVQDRIRPQQAMKNVFLRTRSRPDGGVTSTSTPTAAA